jgi:hypothetical protein
MKDFLGTEIKIGDRGIRVHSYDHSKEFKKVTVKDIDESRKYGDCIGVITDGNSKIGWTYPKRIIVQDSLKVQI